MLTPNTIDAFVRRDTRTVADALIQGSLLGTEVGDRVFAAIGNYPDRALALAQYLTERGAIETAA